MAPILSPRHDDTWSGVHRHGKPDLLTLWITLGVCGGMLLIAVGGWLHWKIQRARDRKKRQAADPERNAGNSQAGATRGVTATQLRQLQVPATTTTDQRRSADVTEARGEIMTEISLADLPKVQQGEAAK